MKFWNEEIFTSDIEIKNKIPNLYILCLQTMENEVKNEYSIDELISMISEDNMHYEIKTDEPVGKENW